MQICGELSLAGLADSSSAMSAARALGVAHPTLSPLLSRMMMAGGLGISKAGRRFSTGLRALDQLLPRQGEGGWVRGAVHELISDWNSCVPWHLAALLARGAVKGEEAGGIVVWSKVQDLYQLDQLYPPALAAAGLPLGRVVLLNAPSAKEEMWALAECLRCKGVGVVVAGLSKISRIEARRLQLAAERGGGVGIFLRMEGRASADYAAATRWRIRPAVGTAAVQRWEVTLIYGHGGQVGKTVYLEVCRDTNHVRAVEELGDAEVLQNGEEKVRASA